MIEGEGPGGDAPQPTQSADEAPSWFREYTALVDKRFEGLAAKLSKAAPTSSTEPAATSAPQQTSDVGELVRAAMAFGEIRSGLTDAARAKLDSLQEQGLSYAQLTAVAEVLRSSRAPARESATATQVAPLGLAASAAPGGSVAHPATVSEYLDLKSKNRTKWNALMADPSFDPAKLRRA
jgi:hypothetical protein